MIVAIINSPKRERGNANIVYTYHLTAIRVVFMHSACVDRYTYTARFKIRKQLFIYLSHRSYSSVDAYAVCCVIDINGT